MMNQGEDISLQYTLTPPPLGPYYGSYSGINQHQHQRQLQGPARGFKRRGLKTTKPNTSICFNCAEPGHSMKQCAMYKMRMCKWWERGECGFELTWPSAACPAGVNGELGLRPNTCLFAHGQHELRLPGVRCVQIISENGTVTINGCRQTGHCFKECPDNGVLPVGEDIDQKSGSVDASKLVVA